MEALAPPAVLAEDLLPRDVWRLVLGLLAECQWCFCRRVCRVWRLLLSERRVLGLLDQLLGLCREGEDPLLSLILQEAQTKITSPTIARAFNEAAKRGSLGCLTLLKMQAESRFPFSLTAFQEAVDASIQGDQPFSLRAVIGWAGKEHGYAILYDARNNLLAVARNDSAECLKYFMGVLIPTDFPRSYKHALISARACRARRVVALLEEAGIEAPGPNDSDSDSVYSSYRENLDSDSDCLSLHSIPDSDSEGHFSDSELDDLAYDDMVSPVPTTIPGAISAAIATPDPTICPTTT